MLKPAVAHAKSLEDFAPPVYGPVTFALHKYWCMVSRRISQVEMGTGLLLVPCWYCACTSETVTIPPCRPLSFAIEQRYRHLHVLDPRPPLPSVGKGGDTYQRGSHGYQHPRGVHVPTAGHGWRGE